MTALMFLGGSIEASFVRYESDNNWNILGVIVPKIDVDVAGERVQIQKSARDKTIAKRRFGDLENFLNRNTHGRMSADVTVLTLGTTVTQMSQVLTTMGTDGVAIRAPQMMEILENYLDVAEFDHVMFFIRSQCEFARVSVPTAWSGLYHGEFEGVHFSQVIFGPSRNCNWHNTTVFPERVLVHEFIHGLEKQSRRKGIAIPSSIDADRAIYGYGNTRAEAMRFYRDWLNGQIKCPKTNVFLGATEYSFLRPRFACQTIQNM